MRFCHVCGSELTPEAISCPICGAAVTAQSAQQPVNPQLPKKAKKKKKNLGIKITAAVLAFIILAIGGLFLADNIMYKNEIEAAEYITDFPVLKTETNLVVFDEVNFPSTDYSIKVERVLYGGVLKSELFKQTKIIIDDTSTDPVYHIDFEEDGEYIITLEDNTEEEPKTTLDFSEDTESVTYIDTDEDNKKEDDDDDDDDTPSKVVIKVTVDDDDDEALDSVNLESKPGDDPVEIPSTETLNEYDRILGTYKGSYFPGQGETGLTLTVYMEDEQCKAIFDFYNLPGRTNSKIGKYYMDVLYDADTDEYSFNSTTWIEQPSSYIFIDLKGRLTGDVLSGDSPTRFSVTKTTDDQTVTPDTETQQPSVDSYARDAELYTAYLTSGELEGIAGYMNKDYIVVESCMVDFDGDGTYELVLSIRDEEYPGPRGYYTISAVYAITDGVVTKLDQVENPGGTGGGDNFYIKYDNQTNKHIVMKTSLGRDGVWAFDYNRTAYIVSGGQLNEYFKITTTFRSFDNTVYGSTAEQIKEEVSLSYEDNGGIYYHKINNNYVTKEDHDEAEARFTEPTDSAYQMKTGAFSNPLGL